MSLFATRLNLFNRVICVIKIRVFMLEVFFFDVTITRFSDRVIDCALFALSFSSAANFFFQLSVFSAHHIPETPLRERLIQSSLLSFFSPRYNKFCYLNAVHATQFPMPPSQTVNEFFYYSLNLSPDINLILLTMYNYTNSHFASPINKVDLTHLHS